MENINRLRELRKRAKLTARQLGELTGYAESTVTAWERSKRAIKPDVARKMLRALGLKSLDAIYSAPKGDVQC